MLAGQGPAEHDVVERAILEDYVTPSALDDRCRREHDGVEARCVLQVALDGAAEQVVHDHRPGGDASGAGDERTVVGDLHRDSAAVQLDRRVRLERDGYRRLVVADQLAGLAVGSVDDLRVGQDGNRPLRHRDGRLRRRRQVGFLHDLAATEADDEGGYARPQVQKSLPRGIHNFIITLMYKIVNERYLSVH